MDESTAKLCDSCGAAPSTVFCRADSAFLCAACDVQVHAANNLASRHARVLLCDVCEHAPAAVTCKADAAALCHACDRDIHSANPLARRHERLPVVPFYDSSAKLPSRSSGDFSEEEAEAASWLLPDPNSKPDPVPEYNSSAGTEYLFADPETGAQKQSQCQQLQGKEQTRTNKQYSTDGVVPAQHECGYGPGQYPGPVVDGYPTYDLDYHAVSKPFMYNFTSQSISQSVSSEVGVVPDHNAMADVSDGLAKSEAAIPTPLSGVDREARVLRYREKRKNRKFAKTIRYASRKAYAETRPRIKGRFAKRSELEVDSLFANDASSYGVVPTYLPAVAN